VMSRCLGQGTSSCKIYFAKKKKIYQYFAEQKTLH